MGKSARKIRSSLVFVLAALAAALVAPLPAGAAGTPLQEAIARGRENFLHNAFGGHGRFCETCHLGGGTRQGQAPDGSPIASLSNAAVIFPRIAEDDHRLITLSDQVRACVGGAIRGTPPDYGSDELNSLVAYLSSLSQGKPLAMGADPK